MVTRVIRQGTTKSGAIRNQSMTLPERVFIEGDLRVTSETVPKRAHGPSMRVQKVLNNAWTLHT